MKTFDCPACGYGFMRRKRRRCPRCESILLVGSERFCNEEGDRLFYNIDGEWREVVPFAGYDIGE